MKKYGRYEVTGVCQVCNGPIHGYWEIPKCDSCLDRSIAEARAKQITHVSDHIDHIIIGQGDGINDIGPGCDGAMG